MVVVVCEGGKMNIGFFSLSPCPHTPPIASANSRSRHVLLAVFVSCQRGSQVVTFSPWITNFWTWFWSIQELCISALGELDPETVSAEAADGASWFERQG